MCRTNSMQQPDQNYDPLQALQSDLCCASEMQAQGHLHSIPQSMGGPYASQSSLQPALHHHQGHQMGPDSDYGQPDTQHMLHNGQHPSHMTDQYHPQVSMYIQQPAQPMLSDVGEQKHDNVALPFPQPSMVTFAQPSMEQPQHPGHMEGASMGPQHPGHMEGASMGPQHQSGSGSDFPPNSPDGALSPGDNSKKCVPSHLCFAHKCLIVNQ